VCETPEPGIQKEKELGQVFDRQRQLSAVERDQLLDERRRHRHLAADSLVDVCDILCGHLQSISPTFNDLFLRQYSFTKKLQSQTVSRKKTAQKTLAQKTAHKMLVKLKPGDSGRQLSKLSRPSPRTRQSTMSLALSKRQPTCL